MTAPREFLLADQPDSKNRAIILDTFGNVVATVENRADAALLVAKPALPRPHHRALLVLALLGAAFLGHLL